MNIFVLSIYLLFLLAFCVFLAPAASNASNLKISNAIAGFFGLAVCALIGGRDLNFGIDTLALYGPVYTEMTGFSDWQVVPQYFYSYDSQFFWLFMAFVKSLGFDFNGFVIIQSCLLGLLAIFVARTFDKDITPFLICYIPTLLFLTGVSNTLRQAFAVLLALLMIVYISRNCFLYAILTFLLLCFVHGTGVVVGGVLLIFLFKTYFEDRRTKKSVQILFGVGALLLISLLFMAYQESFISSFSSKQNFYVDEASSFSTGSQSARPWFLVSTFVFGILLMRIVILKTTGRNIFGGLNLDIRVYDQVYIVFFLFWILFIDTPGIFERLGDYIAGLQVIIFSIIVKKFTNQSAGARIVVFFVLSAFAYFNFSGESVIRLIK